MKSFKSYLREAVAMSPKELQKPNSLTGEKRTDILRREIKAGNPLELKAGGFFVVTDIQAALDAIDKFEKDGKAFKLIGGGGSINSSHLAKSKVFGGGGGGAGGGTDQTATVESAQCLWLQAMLDNGMLSLESFTEEMLTAAYPKIKVDVKLDKILEIDDGWKKSSYLGAKHLIENGFAHKGMVAHRGSDLMKAIYSAKNKALRNQGLSKISDDKWNPGDIWLADASFKASELPTDTLHNLNKKLVELFNQKRLIGVSLKKIVKAAKHDVKNLEEKNLKTFKFKTAALASAQRGTIWTSKGGNVYYDGGSMEIRTNSALGTHKAEIKGKTARGGGAGWGVIINYAKTKLKYTLPKNRELVATARKIASGSSKETAQMFKMMDAIVPDLTEQEFMQEIAKKDAVWIHAKLGVIHMFYAMHKANQQAKDSFISSIVSYAGSELEESSVYVKVYE
jgi:hypothetical protein